MSYEVPIERGKVREFALATKSTHEHYFDRVAVIPPTFLTTAGNFWAPVEELRARAVGFDPTRLLHAEEEFEFFGPPPAAGRTLTATGRAGNRWEREGKRGGTMRFATLITEFRDESGTLVAEQRTTLVETSRPPDAG